VSITSATGIQNNLLNAGDNVSVTVTFSESVIVASGTPTLILVVGSTPRTATYTSGSPSTALVFQYRIQAGDNDTDGISIRANALALDGGTISDPAGNNAILTHSAMSDNNSYKVDTTAPTVNSFTISDSLLTIGETATVDLVFSEAVFGFASAADITDPSGSLASMTSSDNITWTGTFTPTANTEEASNTLSLATSWTDLAGNAGPSETTSNYEVEARAPVSSIEISSATGIQNSFLNAGDNVSVTATFSESVIVDNASGTPTLTLVVGSTDRTATYTSGSGSTSLVFEYTIQAGETDDNGISIEANVLALNSSTIRDAALNNATLTHSAVSANTSYKVDTTLPTVSSVEITSATTGMQNNFLNAGDLVSVTATFNEIVIRTGSPQLTIVVGSADRTATYTSGSGSTTLEFKYTIQAGDNDTNGISIGADVLALNSGTIRDLAGHNATLTHSAVSANTSYKVDTTTPTVNSFTISDSLLTIGETATVALVFSEAVFGFASAADITVPSGSLASMTSSENITWTGTFTPTANREVTSNTLSLATSWTDLAGNAGPAETTANYEVETKAPTGSFTFTDYHFKLGDNATVTLDFSEVVVGFSSDVDITVPNLDNGTTSGTLAAMTSSDNRTWSGTFTPTFPNTQDWSNTLSLTTSYTDTVGNTGTAATSPNYMVDDNDPSVSSFTLSDTNLLAGESATVTLVFSEAVASFSSAADITAAGTAGASDNGSLATMTSSDNITWTGTFRPPANTEEDNNTLSLANSWTDTVGNPGDAATTPNYEVETRAPTVSSFTLSDTALKAGDNATVSLVFSEAVVSFSSAADITVPNLDNGTTSGALAAMTSSDNITWTGTFTPLANTEEDNNTLSLGTSWTDIAGNNGNAATSSPYVVDTKAPSVSSLQLTDGVTTLSTFTDRCFPVTSNIIVTFDDVMEPSYITTSTSDTYCAGSIWVSSDNFSSCVRMSSEPSASNSNQTFTLDPYDNLSFYTTYKVRVKTGVKDVLGNNMSSQYDNSSGFKTSSYPSSSPISGVFVGVGQYGKAVRSIDNGTSWDNETCQILTDLNGVTSGNNTFVAVGDNGTVLRSTDNASSFSTVSPYYVGTSRGVTFGNNTFVAVSDGGKTARSTDNGSSWNNSTSGISSILYGVTFGNNTFVAVGQSGKILRSTDNASSWNNSTSPITSSLYGVSFGNKNFVGVGQNGKIVRSTDNGSSWDNSTSGISTTLYGVTFGNNTFMAVGPSGKILRSTDNGSSWNNSTSGISTTLYGVTFGNNTFVAVGQSGKILRSTDNGSSWNNSTSPITTDLNGVTFSE